MVMMTVRDRAVGLIRIDLKNPLAIIPIKVPGRITWGSNISPDAVIAIWFGRDRRKKCTKYLLIIVRSHFALFPPFSPFLVDYDDLRRHCKPVVSKIHIPRMKMCGTLTLQTIVQLLMLKRYQDWRATIL